MARKKQEIALQTEIESQEEWEEVLAKEGLTSNINCFYIITIINHLLINDNCVYSHRCLSRMVRAMQIRRSLI